MISSLTDTINKLTVTKEPYDGGDESIITMVDLIPYDGTTINSLTLPNERAYALWDMLGVALGMYTVGNG